MSIGIAYNPCKNCKEMDKCSICELTYYRKGCIKSPAADVIEVRHGEWQIVDSDIGYVELECSLCKNKLLFNTDDGFTYCPHCGAKMDGERSRYEHFNTV